MTGEGTALPAGEEDLQESVESFQSSQEAGSGEESEESEADTSRTEVSDHSLENFVQELARRTSHENMPGPELTEDEVDTLVDMEELQKLLKEQMRLTKSAR